MDRWSGAGTAIAAALDRSFTSGVDHAPIECDALFVPVAPERGGLAGLVRGGERERATVHGTARCRGAERAGRATGEQGGWPTGHVEFEADVVEWDLERIFDQGTFIERGFRFLIERGFIEGGFIEGGFIEGGRRLILEGIRVEDACVQGGRSKTRARKADSERRITGPAGGTESGARRDPTRRGPARAWAAGRPAHAGTRHGQGFDRQFCAGRQDASRAGGLGGA